MTDDEKRVFVPNTQLTNSPIVNRTIRDPRRVVSVDLPVRLGAPIDEARTTVLRAIDSVEGLHRGQAKVLVGDVERQRRLADRHPSAPLDANVTQLGSDVREAALVALGEADFLAGSE